MLFHRSEYTKVPLESFGVVVLNKIFNHVDQVHSIGEAYPVIPFSLQDTPESFHRSVINTPGNSGHALSHPGFYQHMVERSTCVLESSVAVTQRVCIWICGNRCAECVKHQRIVIGIPNHIADNPSVIQIQDGTEIYFLYLNANVVLELSNIGQPFLVGLVCLKFPIQQIVCQIIWILALPGTAVVAVLNRGYNSAAPTDPEHSFVIHMGIVVTIQFILEPAVAHFRMLFVDVLNQISNTFVLSGSGRQFACCPSVISRSGNFQYLTRLIYWISLRFIAFFDSKIQVRLPYLR